MNSDLFPSEMPTDPFLSIGVTVTTAPQSITDGPTHMTSPPEEWETALKSPETMDTIRADSGLAKNHQLYSFNKVLGVGGCGEVWEAMQHSLNRRVAVKRIRPDTLDSKTKESSGGGSLSAFLTQSFRQEALTTACLDHPNIVPVYDLGHDNTGQPMIAMKLVEGTPWDVMFKEDVNLPLNERLQKHLPILLDVAQAVAFAHSRGVIHRDIKPSQVMIGEYGEVLLMDWGLACSLGNEEDKDPAQLFTDSGKSLPISQAVNPAGTPAFMAPEQTENSPQNLGVWTDIFLVGATLYLLLTGRPPYNGKSAREVFKLAASCDFATPESMVGENEKIPPELSRVCLKAMAKNPWDRYSTMRALLKDLEDYVIGAGKRRESMDLTNEATQMLSDDVEDYRVLTEIMGKLDQAKALYPTNETIPTLYRRARIDFTKTALMNGDLVLARYHANTIGDEVLRTKFLDDITEAETKRREEKKRSRTYSIITCVLIFVALAAIMIALDRQHYITLLQQGTPAESVAENSAH